MNGQIITSTENRLAEMRHHEIKHNLFVKTSKSLTRTGLALMWATMLLMSVVFLAPASISIVLRLVCLGAFVVMYLFYMAAVRNGGIFEYVAVEQNHTGRQSIFVFGFLVNVAGFIHLAIYSDPIALPVIGIFTAVAVTALRFVGLQK